MPYGIKRRGPGKYEVVNKNTGKIEGHTTSRTKAKAMIRAIGANTHGK